MEHKCDEPESLTGHWLGLYRSIGVPANPKEPEVLILPKQRALRAGWSDLVGSAS